jgi:hypothetical protein
MGVVALQKKVDNIRCPSIFPTNAPCVILTNILSIIVGVIEFVTKQVSDYKPALVMPVLLYGTC